MKSFLPLKIRVLTLFFSACFISLVPLPSNAQSSAMGTPSWAGTAAPSLQVDTPQIDTPFNSATNLTDKLLPKELVSRPETDTQLQTSSEEFLPPEKAFDLASRHNTEEIVFTITPARDYYVYRDKIFALNIQEQNPIQNTLPTGEMKKDPTFGEVQVFHKNVDIHIPLQNIGVYDNNPTFEFHYQGCHIKGLCYNPIKKTYQIKNSQLLEVPNIESTAAKISNTDNSFTLLSNTEHNSFTEKNIFLVVGSFFLFGLLLSLTPCVLPMVPVLFSIISGYHKKHLGNRRTSFYLALLYVLGMALTYTIAGIVAALTGSLASNILQNIWVLGSIALLFVLLSLSMFGVYTIQVPLWLQNKLNQVAENNTKNAKIAVFIMGAVSSLILGPCVAAPMAGALLYIGQTKDVWLGGSALFALSLGMGAPLILISAGAHSILPKTGAWMKITSVLLGFLLLAMALYIIQPFMAVVWYLSIASLLSMAVGVFLFKSTDFLHARVKKANHALLQLFGILFFAYGIVLAVGAYQGASSIFHPLAMKDAQSKLPVKTVKTFTELKSAVANSSKEYVLIDFYAAWCASCIEMDNYTFSKTSVQQALSTTDIIKVDITDSTPQSTELLKEFNLYGPPALIFVDRKFQQIIPTVVGFQAEKEFLSTIDKVKTKK